MYKKRILSFILVIIMIFSFSACKAPSNVDVKPQGPGNGDKSPGTPSIKVDKDKLVVAIFSDPFDMNPNYRTDQYSQMVKHQMYETLFVTDQNGVIQPSLGTEWEYTDDTTLVVKLRKGVKFHSGGELKASDVLFSINLINESSYAQLATKYVDVEKCEAIDDYTVKIKLTQPFAAVINYFNWPLTHIVSEEGYKQIDGDYNKMSIGTGPYKLVKYTKDTETVLEKFEDYWEDGKPSIPNLVFRVIPEDATRTIELESGGIDVATNLSMMDVDRVEANQNLDVLRKPTFQMTYLSFNHEKKYVQDHNVRKAILMAVDWETAINAAFGPRGKYSPTYLAEGVEGYMKTDVVTYDPEGAKKLLHDAGYADNEISINIMIGNIAVRAKLCEMIQAYLSEVGINLDVRVLEQTAFDAATAAGEHDMMMVGLFASTGEGSRVVSSFKSDSQFKHWFFRVNPEYDRIADEAVAEVDKDVRIQKYQKAQELLADEIVIYPLVQNIMLVGTQANVKGLELDSLFESHLFKNVYFE